MAEWVKVEDRSLECHKLRIGRVIATATGECPAFEPGYSIEHDDDPYALEQESIGAAKSAAEQALREMHDALAMHFAPVLRWNDGRAEIKELGWKLWAYSSGYTLQNTRIRIEGRCVQLLTEDENRSAAETALRAMGVVFRTEGE